MISNNDLRDLSYANIQLFAAIRFGFLISKKEQVSNWSRKELTESQQIIAATDAWFGRKIYPEFQMNNLL